MAGTWTKDCTLFTGVIRNKNLGHIALGDDELVEDKVKHSFLAVWEKGKWMEGGKLKWHVVSMGVCKQPKEQTIAISEYGKAWLVGSGDRHEEIVADETMTAKERGSLRCVRGIEGKAYAAGMDRQVWRRDGENKWTCIDESMRPGPRDEVVGFEGIDGFSSRDIYAGGWGGEIWHWQGKAWKSIDSPTNANITKLVCADEHVYAIGRLGLVLRGRGNRWKVLKQEVDEDLWGAAWYRGKLWVASLTQLFTLEGNELEPVEFDDERPLTCNQLATGDGILWSIGSKDLFEFDGKDWNRID